jgi:hypothetical protein
MMTEDEARTLFRGAADAANRKLPRSIADKLTPHLRDIAEYDFDSAVSQLVVGTWLQCARDLVAMESHWEAS